MMRPKLSPVSNRGGRDLCSLDARTLFVTDAVTRRDKTLINYNKILYFRVQASCEMPF